MPTFTTQTSPYHILKLQQLFLHLFHGHHLRLVQHTTVYRRCVAVLPWSNVKITRYITRLRNSSETFHGTGESQTAHSSMIFTGPQKWVNHPWKRDKLETLHWPTHDFYGSSKMSEPPIKERQARNTALAPQPHDFHQSSKMKLGLSSGTWKWELRCRTRTLICFWLSYVVFMASLRIIFFTV